MPISVKDLLRKNCCYKIVCYVLDCTVLAPGVQLSESRYFVGFVLVFVKKKTFNLLENESLRKASGSFLHERVHQQ